MKKTTAFTLLALVISCTSVSRADTFGNGGNAFATQTGRPIGMDDFGPMVVVEDYENLGLGTPQSTPRIIGDATYNSDDGKIRVAQFGPALGTIGYAIGTNSTIGWLDIDLHQPVKRAGIVFGMDWPWAGSISIESIPS